MMKRLKGFVMFMSLVYVLLILPNVSFAATSDISGAVYNENTYEEVVFITGKPVVFKGTSKNIKITEKVTKDKVTHIYDLTLTGDNKANLKRKITYVSDVVDYKEIGQKTANGTVDKYTEKVVIDGMTYTLTDFQFSKGTVTDNRAASDYYSGNVISRKTYTVPGTRNQPAQKIVIKTDSRHVGYANFWGATETQISEYEITNAKGEIGYVKNRLSSSKSRVLNYEDNAASLSSFEGGYAVISSKDMISEYTYDIPYAAGTGEISLNAENMPTIERLIVPKFRDISNSSAKDQVEKLYSLGIYDDQSNYFSPGSPMKRYDFTIALAKAVDLRVLEEKKKTTSSPSIFKDVKRTLKDYAYLETAVKKGVVKGTTADTFSPNRSITRGQAATIIVKALGLENKAPDANYRTSFVDDNDIYKYAHDAVYIVNELGIMTGDSISNRFNPNRPLTRAQSSLVLVRFLEYLENDLKQNYRDDILFFN